VDRLAGIAELVAVVDAGGFTAAARTLGVAKSTLSKKVRRLEDRLGVRLLSRTTRSVELTPAGATFYDRVAGLVDAAAEAAAEVAELSQEPRGTVRVSAPMSFGTRFVVPAVNDFLRRYPAVELQLDLSDRRVDLVREGYDIAIRVGPLGDSSLIARRLCATASRVVGAPSYFAARGRPDRPGDLVDHDGLLYSYQQPGTRWRFRDRGRAVDVAVPGRLVANNGDALADAAAAGLGVALLPDFIVDPYIESGALIAVLDRYCPPPGAVHALYPHRDYRPAAERLFLMGLEAALD
jgi:DNA-binding transcriptional LysR family regulator